MEAATSAFRVWLLSLVDRFKEPSSYAAVVLALQQFGIQFNEVWLQNAVQFLGSVCVFLAFALREKALPRRTQS